MNILKNMEAIFLVSLAIAGPASVVLDVLPQANARRAAEAAVAAVPQPMPVVVVSARRMTEAEKRQSLADEARGGALQVARSGF